PPAHTPRGGECAGGLGTTHPKAGPAATRSPPATPPPWSGSGETPLVGIGQSCRQCVARSRRLRRARQPVREPSPRFAACALLPASGREALRARLTASVCRLQSQLVSTNLLVIARPRRPRLTASSTS